MTVKEAWRHLNHKFHGKAPGIYMYVCIYACMYVSRLDEFGRPMTVKEAWRHLNHAFPWQSFWYIYVCIHLCACMRVHACIWPSRRQGSHVLHTYIHTYIHACIHTYIHTKTWFRCLHATVTVTKYIHIYVHTGIHTYVRLHRSQTPGYFCMCACVYVCMYVCNVMYVCMYHGYVCMCAYVHVCVCMYVGMCYACVRVLYASMAGMYARMHVCIRVCIQGVLCLLMYVGMYFFIRACACVFPHHSLSTSFTFHMMHKHIRA